MKSVPTEPDQRSKAPQTLVLKSLPDDISFPCRAGESILEAALRAGLPMAHACGGNARCSTCRIWLLSGQSYESPPNDLEARLKERLGLGPDIRLACQMRPRVDLSFRRLVLDDADLEIANQLDRPAAAQAGEIRNVAVLFFDVADFTAITGGITPYDTMFLLNKFLAQANRILQRYGGYFDKTIGDGFLALFGVRGGDSCGLRAVGAALAILDAVERARPVVKRAYGIDFYGRIGLHFGEALIGALGPPGEDRLTVIGDVANIASRVEQANKEAGTSLLITEELYSVVRNDVVSPDFLRVGIRGLPGRHTLFEVAALTPAAEARLSELLQKPFSDLPNRSWVNVGRASDLKEGEVRVIPQQRMDIALIRREGRVFAINNHCPHNRLPLFGEPIPEGCGLPPLDGNSTFPAAGQIACRFHQSVFDLRTGRIISWCPALASDGTEPGMEFLGDMSKNERPLEVYRCREFDGSIWIEV